MVDYDLSALELSTGCLLGQVTAVWRRKCPPCSSDLVVEFVGVVAGYPWADFETYADDRHNTVDYCSSG